jgi:hypothetical protein
MFDSRAGRKSAPPLPEAKLLHGFANGWSAITGDVKQTPEICLTIRARITQTRFEYQGHSDYITWRPLNGACRVLAAEDSSGSLAR